MPSNLELMETIGRLEAEVLRLQDELELEEHEVMKARNERDEATQRADDFELQSGDYEERYRQLKSNILAADTLEECQDLAYGLY